MRVVFLGTHEFAVLPLRHLILNQYEVVAVYTQPDKPAGRGRPLRLSAVKEAAQRWNLPVVQPVSLKKLEAVARLAELAPDVIAVAGYGQILPRSVLDLPRYGCINIHPSLLPSFRGASPVAAAILAGDDFTGVTIMLLDQGLDTGPILGRAQVAVSTEDTTGSLSGKLSQVAARLLPEVLGRWVRGEISPQPQKEDEANYCAPITKEEGEIDWHLPVVDIWRRVRAFQPWPGCFTEWQGRRLEVIEALPLPDMTSVLVGQVVAVATEAGGSQVGFGVGTGVGVLGVRRVKLEGKRALPATEFVRGQRQFMGATLPNVVQP